MNTAFTYLIFMLLSSRVLPAVAVTRSVLSLHTLLLGNMLAHPHLRLMSCAHAWPYTARSAGRLNER